ncbi:MAG TPA: 23S rRNA (adenine(2503)-C(2))-methyltransferase RlmN [Humisphaera sp.]
MASLADHSLESLADLLAAEGHKPEHARTVLSSFLGGYGAIDVDGPTIPKAVAALVRDRLAERRARVLVRRPSGDGTVKLLVGLAAGGTVESVLMPTLVRPERAAGCVSSQIGCAMGCDFCASTKNGFERNLDAAEIVEQVLHLGREAAGSGRRLATLVFMGMGEPMLNLPNVTEAIRRISDRRLPGISRRMITVSTVGIVPGIDALADSGLNVHLAVSLHAPDDATRAKIVPMNRRWDVASIVEATRRYWRLTNRVPVIEYTMLDGVNDTEDQAHLLAKVLGGMRAHVNLIPYNAIGPGVSGTVYRPPPTDRMERFLQILRDARFSAHFRITRGADIDAACGQLKLAVLGNG